VVIEHNLEVINNGGLVIDLARKGHPAGTWSARGRRSDRGTEGLVHWTVLKQVLNGNGVLNGKRLKQLSMWSGGHPARHHHNVLVKRSSAARAIRRGVPPDPHHRPPLQGSVDEQPPEIAQAKRPSRKTISQARDVAKERLEKDPTIIRLGSIWGSRSMA